MSSDREPEYVDKQTISLIVNCMLLVSTLVASDFFGIPQYIALNSPAQSYSRLNKFIWGVFYFLGFFFIQLYFAASYLIKLLSGVIYSVKDNSVQYYASISLQREKNAITSLVSMVLALSWCLGIYENSRKKPERVRST